MAKVLIIGCGDLGTAIAARLQQLQHEIIAVRQSDKLSPHATQTIQADVTQPSSLYALEKIHPNIVIYCISASASTDASYQAHYVTGLKNVLATQANNQALLHVFFVSSTRVYGQVTNDLLDENTPAMPADFGGKRLLEGENLLKDFSLDSRVKAQACKATSMRLSGIYGTGRFYLVNMAKDIAKWPAENHWSNRIHRDDAAGFIAFIVDKVAQNQTVKDCYIVTDDMPTQQYEVLNWLANKQGIDTSSIQAPVAHGGKRLSNKCLRETGFNLQYANYQAGYNEILQN